ncbi:phytoene/squalene synthase family protein [Falsiroseomonas sp. CW058]|uniref:phytoene/squalene synthase family protein n=1 Tax=Falsiroseomonas sp. CW058 TaxID=3388664 RepID=UPI003D310283
MPHLPPEISPEDLAACQALLAGGSKSFRAAQLLLPRRVAAPAAALYAFCRIADDEIDLAEGGAGALARLAARLDDAYAGRPQSGPVDRAFAHVAARFAIPRALPGALLEGLAWDAEGRRYEDLPALEAYCARVAAAVGAMMTLLMGVRDAPAIARACDLGVGMQLTNIARDVGEDARNGRIYLPLSWLREEGVEPEVWLAAPRFTPAIGRVVARLLAAADACYARSEAGIPLLPRDCRAGIGAARFVYAGIGRAVERQGLDSIAARAWVPGRRKAWLMLSGLRALAWRVGEGAALPPLPATRFLVEAVANAPAPSEATSQGLGERIAWAADLLARLDGMDRRTATG